MKTSCAFAGCRLSVALALTFAAHVWAGDYTWQGASSALWNAADANWTGAGSVWVSAGTNSAIFGASSSQALTADAIALSNLTFSANGYSIGGGPLAMGGYLSVATNVTATLTTPITHAVTNYILLKTGPGTAVLNPGNGSASNIFATLKVMQGTLQVAGGTNVVTLMNGQPESNPAFWVSGGTLLMGGGYLKSTGNMYGRVSEYGTLLVTNGYADLSSYSELLNGHNAPGVVTVAGTGTLDVKTLRISQNSFAANLTVVNINTGGVLRLNVFGLDAGSLKNGTVNFNGGTVVAKDGSVQYDFLGTTNINWRNIAVNVLAGGAIVDNNTFSFCMRQNMSGSAGDGGFTKLNGGMLTMRGTNTFTGGFRIKGGGVNIIRDHNLGAVPATPSTNVWFLGNATLQSSDNYALAANRTIWITNAVTATFDSQSYTQTVKGAVVCAETNATFYKTGNGVVVLDPGPTAVNTFGTLQQTAGMLVVASGTNYVTQYCGVQNGPGLRINGGTLLVAGGYLKTTSRQYVNVDGGTLLVTNGVLDTLSCDEILNGIGSVNGFTTVGGSGTILANRIRLSQNTTPATNNVVTLNAGGTLSVGSFYIDTNFGGQKGMLVLNGGTIQTRTDTADFLGLTTALSGSPNDRWLTNVFVRVREGGARFDTAGRTISVKQPLVSDVASDGGLTKLGLGSLTLLNTNAYVGVTRVVQGTLVLGTNDTLMASGSASVSSGAVLNVGGKVQTLAGIGGGGWVTNNALLTVAGTIAPGDATNVCGTLSLASPCALSGTLAVDLSASGACDCLYVNGNLDVSGLALSLTNPGEMNKFHRYTVAACGGTLTGTFTSAPLPRRWFLQYDAKKVQAVYNFGTLLRVL